MRHDLFVINGRPLLSKVLASGDLKQSITRAVELIGGIDKLVEKGDTVLLKPNYNTADPYPGSSDPNFIGAVIDVLHQAGAEKIIVGERTAFLHNRKVLEKTGLIEVARKAGAEVTVFGRDGWQTLLDRTGWRRVRVEGGKFLHSVSLARQALEAQKIVYVPLIKTHHAAQFTGSIKLSMGLVKPFFDQSRFHAQHLQEKLAELGLIIKPDLIIMDARKVFITGGPAKGELRTPNLVLASGNQIITDVEGVKILQSYPGNALEDRNVWDLTQIRHAVELGLGPSKEEEYEVKTD
jgi:uncharacterized protein (DUF362 family)